MFCYLKACAITDQQSRLLLLLLFTGEADYTLGRFPSDDTVRLTVELDFLANDTVTSIPQIQPQLKLILTVIASGVVGPLGGTFLL